MPRRLFGNCFSNRRTRRSSGTRLKHQRAVFETIRGGTLWLVMGLVLLCYLVTYAHAAAASCQPPAAGETDITRQGTVTASAVYPGYPASLTVDCETTTSWFSTGPEPGGVPTVLRWNGTRDDLLTTVRLVSNHDHPQFPTDFGFGQVTVRILDAANTVVYQETVPLPGTPDPDVELHPRVVGRTVELLFNGHEAPDCGGFAELQILADRTPPTPTRPPALPTRTPLPPTEILPTVAVPTIPAPTELPTAVVPTVNPATLVPPTGNSAATASVPTRVSAAQGTTAVAPPGARVTALPGDCDSDARVTEADALCALEISVGLREPLPQMDLDGDGRVTSRDAVLLLERAVNQ